MVGITVDEDEGHAPLAQLSGPPGVFTEGAAKPQETIYKQNRNKGIKSTKPTHPTTRPCTRPVNIPPLLLLAVPQKNSRSYYLYRLWPGPAPVYLICFGNLTSCRGGEADFGA